MDFPFGLIFQRSVLPKTPVSFAPSLPGTTAGGEATLGVGGATARGGALCHGAGAESSSLIRDGP